MVVRRYIPTSSGFYVSYKVVRRMRDADIHGLEIERMHM